MTESPSTTQLDLNSTSKELVDGQEPSSLVPPVPDGGLQAWLTVIGGFMVLFSTFGYATSFGVFQDLYVISGASTSSNISWIGSLQLFFMFSMGLPAGKLFDEGYFHYTQFVGSLIYIFSMFMLSLASPDKYYQLLLSQGIGMGIGSGLLVVPSLSIQAHHWRKRRALAMGIVLSGTSLGGVIYPIMLNQLFKGSAGFHWGVRASAFLTLGFLAISNCIMTTRLPSAKQRPPGPKPDVKGILTDKAYMIALFGGFFTLFGLYFPYFYLQLWVTLHGLSPTLGFYTIAILNAGAVFGRTIPNLLADLSGQFNVLFPVTFANAVLVFAMFGVTSPGAVVVFSILYGFFSGAFISLLPPTIAVLSRNMEEIGIRMGFSFFVTSFAMLTGTPISGALLTNNAGLTVHWSRPIIFSGVTISVGTALMFLSRYLFSRRQNSQHV